jgi:thymidylate synthase
LTKEEKLEYVRKYVTPVSNDSELVLILSTIPTRAISLMWNQRSVDTFLGLPFNIASYGLLLEIIAKEVNMVPDELIGNLGDTHLYLDHIEQAKEQIPREPYPLPKLFFKYEKETYVNDYELDGFILKDYQAHPHIKAPLSN